MKGKVVDVYNFLTATTKRKAITIAVLVFAVVFIVGVVQEKKDEALRQAAHDEYEARVAAESANYSTGTLNENSYDSKLKAMQPDLEKVYGSLPEGYLWETDGTMFSLGDPTITAEEAMYAYLNGLRTLDISMAQKYSRGSTVVKTYETYFGSVADYSRDYGGIFNANMYKEMLLSIQPGSIRDTSIFAENKQVFTLNLSVLDLSKKDFWLKDKDEIYNNLYIYGSSEDDSAKVDNYLYDYILDYYRSGDAARKDLSVNITVQRYPDLSTGWLVSSDVDLDSILRYKDGNAVVSYIRSQYREEGLPAIMEKKRAERESERVAEQEEQNQQDNQDETEGGE